MERKERGSARGAGSGSAGAASLLSHLPSLHAPTACRSAEPKPPCGLPRHYSLVFSSSFSKASHPPAPPCVRPRRRATPSRPRSPTRGATPTATTSLPTVRRRSVPAPLGRRGRRRGRRRHRARALVPHRPRRAPLLPLPPASAVPSLSWTCSSMTQPRGTNRPGGQSTSKTRQPTTPTSRASVSSSPKSKVYSNASPTAHDDGSFAPLYTLQTILRTANVDLRARHIGNTLRLSHTTRAPTALGPTRARRTCALLPHTRPPYSSYPSQTAL